MKILTICIGGVVRSVGLADVLKNNYSQDAVALSSINNSDETMAMMCEWADLICPVEPRYEHKVPEQYKNKWENCKMWDTKYDTKRKVFNIGEDVWGNARDTNLVNLIQSKIKEII